MKKTARYFVVFATVLILVTVYSMGTRAVEVTSNSSTCIEVGGDGIACVPPGTEFVTYNGEVMRVIAVIPLEKQYLALQDCYCPHCCNGECARIVRCTDSGTKGLCIIILTC
jgi:hypothetical protein